MSIIIPQRHGHSHHHGGESSGEEESGEAENDAPVTSSLVSDVLNLMK